MRTRRRRRRTPGAVARRAAVRRFAGPDGDVLSGNALSIRRPRPNLTAPDGDVSSWGEADHPACFLWRELDRDVDSPPRFEVEVVDDTGGGEVVSCRRAGERRRTGDPDTEDTARIERFAADFARRIAASTVLTSSSVGRGPGLACELVGGRPGRDVDRTFVAPRPGLLGHERQKRGEEAQLESRAIASARRAETAARSRAVGAGLHELEVVVAEGPEERLVRSSARACS